MSTFIKATVVLLILAATPSSSIHSSYLKFHVFSFIWSAHAVYNLSSKDIIESCMGGEKSMVKAGVAFDTTFVSDLPLFFWQQPT